MSNYQWYLNEKRQKLIKEAEEIPEAKAGLAALLEVALEEYVKNHKSGNPQYKLETWTDDPNFIAIPALLAQREKRDKWINLQAKKKNWKDLESIKFALQEWQGQLRRYGIT